MTHAWHSARPEAQAATRAYLLKLHLQLAQLAQLACEVVFEKWADNVARKTEQ